MNSRLKRRIETFEHRHAEIEREIKQAQRIIAITWVVGGLIGCGVSSFIVYAIIRVLSNAGLW